MTDSQPRRPEHAIARRRLSDFGGGGDVEIVLYAPQREASAERDWECLVEVRQGDDVDVALGRGVDSLGALHNAHAALYRMLQNRGHDLALPGGQTGAIGLPLLIAHWDPDHLKLLDELNRAEACRQLITHKLAERSIDSERVRREKQNRWLEEDNDKNRG